jgi:integrase
MKQRGVYERVQGSDEWWIRYADSLGRIRREKAGTKSAAVTLYHKRKTQVLEGRKLPERLRRKPISFRELAQDALAHSRQHKRSYRDDCSRMARLVEWFGDRPAESITPVDIEHRLSSQTWAAATINRYRALLSLTYNLGTKHGKVNVNPARLVQPRRECNVRTGFVDDAQYTRLAQACDSLWLRTLLALGYTYGWRKAELLGQRVGQVNLLDHMIHLEPGTTKNEEGRSAKLTKECYELVKACIAGKQLGDYVFTREDGGQVRDFSKAWAELCVKTGFGKYYCRRCNTPGKPCPSCAKAKRRTSYCYRGLIFHDLRRSAVRNMERSDVPRSVAMRITGHKTEAVYRRYAIVSPADLAEASRKLEKRRLDSQSKLTPELTPDSGVQPTSSGNLM